MNKESASAIFWTVVIIIFVVVVCVAAVQGYNNRITECMKAFEYTLAQCQVIVHP